jgi:hypothetical protein
MQCWLRALEALIQTIMGAIFLDSKLETRIQTIMGAIFLDSYLDIELVWKVPYST